MLCLNCGLDNETVERFCIHCGVEFTLACPRCGIPNRRTAKFCGHCAEPLSAIVDRSPASAGERRQITVLFCDLVGSSGISERLDPEDWRDLLRRYQAQCAEVVRGLDGHVAQYLGDGLLVYFGYPRAHENAPERAVRAALAIIDAVRELGFDSAGQRVPLHARIGIHTGLAVVGEMGDSKRPELLAVGETPNIAARVQSVAKAGSVVVSEATHRCVRGYFTFRELGPVALKGFTRPATLFEVEAATGARSRIELAEPASLTPLAGRDEELDFLNARWNATRVGAGPVVLVSGEPGIGKSRLVSMLRERVALDGARTLECFGSPLFQGTALHPIREMLELELGLDREMDSVHKTAALRSGLGSLGLEGPDTTQALAFFLSIVLGTGMSPLPPQKQRQATFEALVAWLHARASDRLTLLVLEDLHWVDPSTLELVGMLVERPPGALMVVLTHRPEFVPRWSSPRLSTLTLRRVPANDATRIVSFFSQGAPLPGDVVGEILAKADGVPLYLEEITKSVLESRSLYAASETEPAAQRPAMSIPATLQDSLTARLDRLSTGKPIIQLAATLGWTFRFELLLAVSRIPENELRDELDRLVAVEMLLVDGAPPDATYTFKHALIQDAAYDSLLRGVRRANHARIARALNDRFPQVAMASPELLAHHYAGAGAVEEAVAAWMRAGEQATAKLARVFERIAHSSADPDHRLIAYCALGVRAYWCASYGEARRLFDAALAYFDPNDPSRQMALLQTVHGFDGYLYPLIYLAWCDLVEGSPSRSWDRWDQALAFAEKVGNPYAIAMVLSFGAHLAYDSADPGRTLTIASRQAAVSAEHGFVFWLGIADALAGWAEVRLGKVDAGFARLESGLAVLRQIGGYIVYGYLRAALAEAYLLAERVDEALSVIDEAIAFAGDKLALNYMPFMILLRGDILAHRGDAQESEHHYRRALEVFREQGARLMELRASLSLARLLKRTARSGEAMALLSRIAGHFDDDADLPGLRAARTLIGELASALLN
jgi:class 3 adenylate cyclase/tetratricopeptide (TPR) repeat protein